MTRLARGLFFIAFMTLAPAARALAQGSPVVAARRISRGAILSGDDIAGPSDVVAGWIARRVINAGEALAPPAVSPPPVIRSRQTVDVLVGRGSIRVLVTGTALADATLGDTILVRLDTRRRVRAVVAGPGRVTALIRHS